MSMRVVWLLVLSAILSAFAGGCAWSRTRMNDPAVVERAKAIRVGVTKADELPTLLGVQPTRKRLEAGKVVYEYSYSDAKEKVFTLIIVSFSRTEDVTETLYVEADAATGIVTGVPVLRHREPEWRFWPFDEE